MRKYLLQLSTLLILSFHLSGCIFTYLIKSGYEQSKLLYKREPIEKVLKNKKLDAETKRKLELAMEARIFAEEKLGLKPTKNYSTYVDLKRPYVTYALQVAPIYELKHHLWSYPMVGQLPYKGFFSKQEALEESKKFPADKFDTYVRGVTAYSTLGWFNDPILSSMIAYQDHDLVNVIIHETVHATIFIKGKADFNESLATFIGNTGTELFYIQKEGKDSPTVLLIKKENHDDKLFSQFIQKQLEDLKTWYESESKAKTITAERKKNRIKELQIQFAKQLKPKLLSNKYDYFAKADFNNAKLLSYKTYFHDLSDFEKLLIKKDNDFHKMLEFCKSLEKEKAPSKKVKEFVSI